MSVQRAPDIITLDVHAQSIQTAIYFVTGDIGAYKLRLNIKDSGAIYDLTGKTVGIICKAPNASAPIVDSVDVTDAVNGVCEYLVSNSVYANAGVIQSELHIFDGSGDRLSTCAFALTARQGLDDGAGVEATDNYGILSTLIANVQSIEDLIYQDIDQGDPSTELVDLDLDEGGVQ